MCTALHFRAKSAAKVRDLLDQSGCRILYHAHTHVSVMKKSKKEERGLFAEAASSGKRELVLRKDAVTEKVVQAIEGGEDTSMFAVTSLNNLQLSGFAGVARLSRVGGLTALLQLGLVENGLDSLPDEIGCLPRLKLLDVSRNKLSSLPTSLFLLPALQTLIIANNCLTDSSFPEDMAGEVLPQLHQLDVTGNKLTSLPSFLSMTTQLAELRVAHNSLSSLSPALVQSLVGLRVLEAQENQLKSLPHELAACSKLKTVRLEGNPLKDRRLLKLVAQHGTHKPKAVLDYLASRGPGPAPVGKKKGKTKAAVQSDGEEEDVEFSLQLPEVAVVRPQQGKGLEVVATGNARKVRPYLVCTVMRGVALATEDSMREFISLQTKLHDTVCKRRRSATIATHDLAKVTPPVSYSVAPATDVAMTPLGWSEEVKVQQFLDHVEANKPGSGGRKAKGVDTTAASLFK